jgi:cyclopropane-fatty-acyl-phospholipid synthase
MGLRTYSVDVVASKTPRVNWLDRWLAAQVQRRIAPVSVRIELWDGTSPGDATASAIGALVVRDRGTLAGLAIDPDLYFGECYMAGRLDVRGALEPILEALSKVAPPERSWQEQLRAALAIPNTLTRSRRNVQHHYDLGNDFYRTWLDPDLVYTCAYYERPDMSLEQAQRAKLDLVCRKLHLGPGDTVVEAGCGWGALALYMARQYGAQVKAFNVSHEQLTWARARARREGLSARVEFIDDDYRNISGQFDAFVSVGMIEHVGVHQFRTLADVIRRSVRRSGGRGLLHFIGRDAPRPLNAWIRRRIFPGAYPPTLAEVATHILAPAGLSIVDVENLRRHYALTLLDWRRRFASARDEMRAQYGEPFTRAWELYLAGSQAAFATGWMQLFQVVFAPFESTPPHWARSSIYRPSGSSHAPL